MGPIGPRGATGETGPQGEGLMQGSLLILPAGSNPPSRSDYRFVGTYMLLNEDAKKKDGLAVDVYRRR